MKKHYNKKMGYYFYIEELGKQSELERIKVYDENKNYIDYLNIEYYKDNELKKEIEKYIEMWENFETIDDLLCSFSSCWNYGKTLRECVEEIFDEEYQNKDDNGACQSFVNEVEKNLREMSELDFCLGYNINKLGKYYFSIED